jgi:hypothetical protein
MFRFGKSAPSERRFATNAPPITSVKPMTWIALNDAVNMVELATLAAIRVLSSQASSDCIWRLD